MTPSIALSSAIKIIKPSSIMIEFLSASYFVGNAVYHKNIIKRQNYGQFFKLSENRNGYILQWQNILNLKKKLINDSFWEVDP